MGIIITTIRCIICGTKNTAGQKITGSKNRINLKIYQYDRSSTSPTTQYEINCPLCEKRYVAVVGAYPEFLKNHLTYTDVALADIKRIFPRLKTLDQIPEKSTGIAKIVKRAQRVRSKDYDIAFKIGKKRSYLHCKKKKRLFVAVSAYEV